MLDAGYAADSLATPGTARLALAMLDEGTKTRDALQIAEQAELLGAQLGSGSSLDTSYLLLNAITGKLPESIEHRWRHVSTMFPAAPDRGSFCMTEYANCRA